MIWDLLELIFWVFFSGGWMEEGYYTYVPYEGAIYDVDLNDKDLTNVGTLTAGNLTVGGSAISFGDYVPYTGADTAVDLGSQNLTTTGIITGNTLTDGTLVITGGNLTTTGTIEGGTLTEGGVGVPNTDDNLSVFAATTSAQLYGVLSDETGSGAGALAVFNISPQFETSILGNYLTASEMVITDASKNIVSAPVATYPSLTELSYVKGLSSAVQTQITAKVAKTDPVMVAFTLVDPDTTQAIIDAVTIFPIEAEKYPNGITITDFGIKTAASSSYSVVLEEWTAPGTHSADLETVATSTSLEAEDNGTIGNGSGGGAGDCNVGSIIKIDLPTDDIDELSGWIVFTVNQS